MENFLKSIELIISKYKEIEKITGEHYNIFSVMGMENNEVKTHSAIIGDLLNPNGSHFMGDVFLELFIDSVLTQSEYENLNEFTFQTQNSNCIVEESVGKKNDEEITGGRIDIVLKDLSNNIIVIENKIFAPEQENQIPRYKNTYSEAAILYLTLFGDEPKNIGELKKGIDFYLISYKEDIIRWLELCLKETVNQPILRETLKQYIVLIKKLTNQSTNNKMSEEIIKIIESNFDASAEIYKNFEKALEIKQSIFLEKLKDHLSNNLTKKEYNNWKVESIGNGSNEHNEIISKVRLTDKNIIISFHFKNLKNPFIAIEKINKHIEIKAKKQKNSLGFRFPDWPTETCLLWQHRWSNLGNAENLIPAEKSLKYEEISNFLIKVIDNLKDLLENYNEN